MNRRAFFQRASLGAVSAGLAAAVAPAVGANGIVFAHSKAGVHILGDTPSTPDQWLFKALSDDVFRRLTEAFRAAWPTRAMRVIAAERLGEAVEEGELAYQWNTALVFSTAFASERPPYFSLEEFQAGTNQWTAGSVMSPCRLRGFGYTPADVPIQAMFEGRRVVGMPHLPDGMIWRAHYVDEDTGLVMRAVATFPDIAWDEYAVRWDVICG